MGRVVLGILRAECEFRPEQPNQVANGERIRGHLKFLDEKWFRDKFAMRPGAEHPAEGSWPDWLLRDWIP